MGWNTIEPPVRIIGRPMVSASVLVRSRLGVMVWLNFADTFIETFKRPTNAVVAVGDGDELGQVMVRFTPEGPFEVRYQKHGGARLILPALPVAPERSIGVVACKLIHQETENDNMFVLALPVEEWNKPKALPPPRAVPALPSPTPDTGRAPAPDSLNPVAYLTKKGHKAFMLAGGQRFQIDGELHSREQTLERVNAYRRKDDLPPITSLVA